MNNRDLEYKVERVIKHKLFSMGETVAKYITYALLAITGIALLALMAGMFSGAESLLRDNKLNSTLEFICEDHNDYSGYDGYNNYITPICGNEEFFETKDVKVYIDRVERFIRFICRACFIGLISIALAYLTWELHEWCNQQVKIYE